MEANTMANEKEPSLTQQVVARSIGGALVAVTMAAIGPVATLALGVGVNAYIFCKVMKD